MPCVCSRVTYWVNLEGNLWENRSVKRVEWNRCSIGSEVSYSGTGSVSHKQINDLRGRQIHESNSLKSENNSESNSLNKHR